jgi:hypothetical protein
MFYLLRDMQDLCQHYAGGRVWAIFKAPQGQKIFGFKINRSQASSNMGD